MQSALRPYATAGVAIVGASVIAITPMAAPLPDTATVRDVALTAGDGAWADVFNETSANLTQLLNNFSLAPFVGAQQALVNQDDFAQQLINDPAVRDHSVPPDDSRSSLYFSGVRSTLAAITS